MRGALFALLASIPLFLHGVASSVLTEQEFLKRIEAQFTIGDYERGLKDAQLAHEQFPASSELCKAYIRALVFKEEELPAISLLRSSFADTDSTLMEEVAWGVLQNGSKSSQYNIKFLSLLGSYFTRDARAVKMILNGLKDDNGIIREVAVQLSSDFRDEPLKRVVRAMLKKEKAFGVRLEAIKAVGKMKLKEAADQLKKIAAGDGTYEEKSLAIEALVSIYDDISEEEFGKLVKSPKAGLRRFAIKAASYFEKEKAGPLILESCFDPISDVRIEALNAAALLKGVDEVKLKAAFEKLKKDSDPKVAITAAWAALLKFKDPAIKNWLYDKDPESRRLAAAAVASSGQNGVVLALEAFEKSPDPYIRANLALGLLGQRAIEKKCCDELYKFLKNRQELLMWDNSHNELFRILSPSKVGHIEQIPNYPEVVDQSLELELLSLLAIKEDKRAEEGIRCFLKKKNWGLTGMAAVTLLQEGSEESLKALRSLLNDPDKIVRCQAALVLAAYGKDESVVSVLQEAYEGADRELKMRILEALGYVGREQSYNFFLKAMEEPFQALRIIAASGLIQAIYR